MAQSFWHWCQTPRKRCLNQTVPLPEFPLAGGSTARPRPTAPKPGRTTPSQTSSEALRSERRRSRPLEADWERPKARPPSLTGGQHPARVKPITTHSILGLMRQCRGRQSPRLPLFYVLRARPATPPAPHPHSWRLYRARQSGPATPRPIGRPLPPPLQ